MPYPLKKDLDIFIDDMINSEMDMLICIDGKEGTGKSRTARLIGTYISKHTKIPFNQDNIHFTTKDYIQSSEKGSKGQINVLDESREQLNKKRGMSKSNVFFTNWLSENRDKQQAHIIILPAIHDLDNYVAVWRMSLLIHQTKYHEEDNTTMSKYRLVRGGFKVYHNNQYLQQAIFNKQRFGYYAYPKFAQYSGTFKDCEPFTAEQLRLYKDKKAKLRAEKYSEMETGSPDRMGLSQAAYVMNKKYKIAQSEIARELGMSAGKVNGLIKDYEFSIENDSSSDVNIS